MKKNLNLFLIALFAGALSFSSCKKDEDTKNNEPTPNPASGFTFGKINNQWSFNAITSMLTDTTTFIKILSNTGGNKYACLLSMMGGMSTDTLYYFITNDEIGNYPDENNLNNKFTLVKNNDVVNNMYTFINTSGDTIFRKIISINQSINVPAGTFSCFKIEETNSSTTGISTFYINKTAGFVKVETPNFTLELRGKNF